MVQNLPIELLSYRTTSAVSERQASFHLCSAINEDPLIPCISIGAEPKGTPRRWRTRERAGETRGEAARVVALAAAAERRAQHLLVQVEAGQLDRLGRHRAQHVCAHAPTQGPSAEFAMPPHRRTACRHTVMLWKGMFSCAWAHVHHMCP